MPHFFGQVPLYILKHLVEREAQSFRRYMSLGSLDPVDPFSVAEDLGVEVRDLHNLGRVPIASRDWLVTEGCAVWSGVTAYHSDGRIVTVLNPAHSLRRRAATLMEEIGHVYLGHGPSLLFVDETTGQFHRSYDKRTETEAYWFGSAILVPKLGLKELYHCGQSPESAAAHYGVSVELIRFRSNLHRLWKRAG